MGAAPGVGVPFLVVRRRIHARAEPGRLRPRRPTALARGGGYFTQHTCVKARHSIQRGPGSVRARHDRLGSHPGSCGRAGGGMPAFSHDYTGGEKGSRTLMSSKRENSP